MTERSELIARVEKATGSDRQLDHAIEVALGIASSLPTERYTASLDAVVAQVWRLFPGQMIELKYLNAKRATAMILAPDCKTGTYAEAATLELALLLACLRALQSKGTNDEG